MRALRKPFAHTCHTQIRYNSKVPMSSHNSLYCAPLGTSMLYTTAKALFDSEGHTMREVTGMPNSNQDQADSYSGFDATANFFLNQPPTDEGACGLDDQWSKREQKDLCDFIARAEAESDKLFSVNNITKIVDVGCGTGRFTAMWPRIFPNLRTLVLVEPCGHFLLAAADALKTKYSTALTADKVHSFGADPLHMPAIEFAITVPGNQHSIEVLCYQLTIDEYTALGNSPSHGSDIIKPLESSLLVTTGVVQYLSDEQLLKLPLLEHWTLLKEDVSVATYQGGKPNLDGTVHFKVPMLGQFQEQIIEKVRARASPTVFTGGTADVELPVSLCYPIDGGRVRSLQHFEQLLGPLGGKHNMTPACRDRPFTTTSSGIQWDLPGTFFSPLGTWLLKRK